jgi:hypothetical protein
LVHLEQQGPRGRRELIGGTISAAYPRAFSRTTYVRALAGLLRRREIQVITRQAIIKDLDQPYVNERLAGTEAIGV